MPTPSKHLGRCASAALLGLAAASVTSARNTEPDVPTKSIDLRTTSPATHAMSKVYGPSRNQGDAGVPVCGGFDVDGDGRKDYTVGHFLTSPLGRNGAGEVNVIFGDGSANDSVNLAVSNVNVLRIIGAGTLGQNEACGNEVWMGDLNGDGFGDVIVCRQNYSFNPGSGNRIGAGALSVVMGSPQLRSMATAGQDLDLANPPVGVDIVTLIGPHANSRLGIWARAGDIDGDGIDDLLVAADQEQTTAVRAGAAYVVRGGAHFNQSVTVDLNGFGTTALAGQIARITPPANATEFHLGSTNQVGDLDGNGRMEVLLSAALNRSGAAVGPSSGTTQAVGGAPPSGWAFVVWDDNFPGAPWPAGLTIDMQNPSGSITTFRGGANNDTFGEELLGGKDYDGDGNADLFIGDLTGDATGGSRPFSGCGYVFFHASLLRGMIVDVDSAPGMNIPMTTIIGPSVGAIGADTVADGDLDGDGIDDLVFGSPTDSPVGRNGAGSIQIFFGQQGGWPSTIDTAPGQFPPQSVMRITEVIGAYGSGGFGNSGDTLCYSAAAGDVDDDGLFDLFVNEMRGDGLNAAADYDAGNLLVLTGPFLQRATESIGTPFCSAAPNSTGVAGTTTALGSLDLADSDLQVEAAHLPQNSVGYFLASTTQGFVAQPGGSAGNLCLGGSIGRYAGNVLDSSLFGSFTLWIDTASMPSPMGSVAIQPGETWSFQAWHRDTTMSGPTSNFTQGLAIQFQ
ncbi:MAG: hypothetical protein R3F49_12430 [Planctomycetota bacterium]